jgi:hypothetical protein
MRQVPQYSLRPFLAIKHPLARTLLTIHYHGPSDYATGLLHHPSHRPFAEALLARTFCIHGSIVMREFGRRDRNRGTEHQQTGLHFLQKLQRRRNMRYKESGARNTPLLARCIRSLQPALLAPGSRARSDDVAVVDVCFKTNN